MPRTKPAAPVSVPMSVHIAAIRQAQDRSEQAHEEIREAQTLAAPWVEQARGILAQLDAFEEAHGEALRALGQLSDDGLPPTAPVLNLWARVVHGREALKSSMRSTREDLSRAIADVEELTPQRLARFDAAALPWGLKCHKHAPQSWQDTISQLHELLGQLAAMVAKARGGDILVVKPLPPAPSGVHVDTGFDVLAS
jgi:hypothetical protein